MGYFNSNILNFSFIIFADKQDSFKVSSLIYYKVTIKRLQMQETEKLAISSDLGVVSNTLSFASIICVDK